LAAAAGALGMVWGPASYFVSRGDATANLMTPMLLVALGVALYLSRRVKLPAGILFLLHVSLAAVLFTVSSTALRQVSCSRGLGGDSNLRPLSRLPTLHIERYMPRMDPSLQAVLDGAGVRTDDPLVFLDFNDLFKPLWFQSDSRGRVLSKRHPCWLPIPSPVVLVPLPPERAPVYVDRFLGRHAAAGWLIRRKGSINQCSMEVMIMEQLLKTHRVTRAFDDTEWNVEWYDPK